MNVVIPGRGASPASPEPKNTGKINQWFGLYAGVPGPTLTGRPGMTRGFFSSLLVVRTQRMVPIAHPSSPSPRNDDVWHFFTRSKAGVQGGKRGFGCSGFPLSRE
jgi:hypothetical protein